MQSSASPGSRNQYRTYDGKNCRRGRGRAEKRESFCSTVNRLAAFARLPELRRSRGETDGVGQRSTSGEARGGWALRELRKPLPPCQLACKAGCSRCASHGGQVAKEGALALRGAAGGDAETASLQHLPLIQHGTWGPAGELSAWKNPAAFPRVAQPLPRCSAGSGPKRLLSAVPVCRGAWWCPRAPCEGWKPLPNSLTSRRAPAPCSC